MIISKNRHFTLASYLFAALFCSTQADALHIGTFNNSGSWKGVTLNFDTNTTNNTGEIIAEESLTLLAREELSGNGLLEAPVINISTKTFAFTGIIRCSGTCTIETQTPFDHAMFTKEGTGEFIFKVSTPNTTTPLVNTQIPAAIRALCHNR
ncbi:MAG: hypothetical protein UV38_C0002G0124 [candidate division TM6 bacterium GW2011_GWE2_42_60]|nr:MAG: hypothetical protein UV38_C0002G0124 [candidate division TM6 bacterium GW2011_GWE2_42_60]HBY06118.1 hypothetical protein [Candidatus Dependentiae bacterium]